jgi:hypothetical protein
VARRRFAGLPFAVAFPLLSFLPGGAPVNWFNLALVGWIILIAALAIAAYMMHAPVIWIAIGALALLGIAVISAVGKSKPQV